MGHASGVSDRVAVITDIHANLPALEAALERIEDLGIERVYCGGDLVGYGPHPNEVCALIAERKIPTITATTTTRSREISTTVAAPTSRRRIASSASTRSSGRSRTPIGPPRTSCETLPFDLHFQVADKDVHLVHGSPRKVNEYLFEDKPASLYERLAAAERDDVLVFGHTHKPWVREHGGVLFVNCGSVGKPKDGDPRGAFAVLDGTGADVEVTIERVLYDVEAVAVEVREAGLPVEYADKLVLAA